MNLSWVDADRDSSTTTLMVCEAKPGLSQGVSFVFRAATLYVQLLSLHLEPARPPKSIHPTSQQFDRLEPQLSSSKTPPPLLSFPSSQIPPHHTTRNSLLLDAEVSTRHNINTKER